MSQNTQAFNNNYIIQKIHEKTKHKNCSKIKANQMVRISTGVKIVLGQRDLDSENGQDQ